jgi:hypothetical protein
MRDDDRSDSSTSTVLIVLGVVFGVLLLVVLACGALSFFAIRSASNAIGPAVQAAAEVQQAEGAAQMFLNTLQAGQVDVAYNSTTPAFQAKQTLKQFQKFVDQNPLLTKFAEVESDDPNHTAGAARMTIPYTLSDNKNGVINVTFHLVLGENGQWQVDGLTIP